MAKKILIVDDEPSILKVLASRFKKEGYDVVTASEGKSGIAQAKKEKPDLILLDIVLPGKNGYEICKALKSKEATQAIKVILCTSKIDAIDIEKARRVGADDFIAKMSNSKELLEAIRKLI